MQPYWSPDGSAADIAGKFRLSEMVISIGMYLHGFEKRILPDINKWSSLGVRWEQAEA